MIEFQPVRMAMDSDEEGRLVFVNGRLAAVAVRLSDDHGELTGQWFVEAAFGPYQRPVYPTFQEIGLLEGWVTEYRSQARGMDPGAS